MAVSYKKLWKLLIDRDMLVKICTALKCDISDIMEIIEIEGEKA